MDEKLHFVRRYVRYLYIKYLKASNCILLSCTDILNGLPKIAMSNYYSYHYNTLIAAILFSVVTTTKNTLLLYTDYAILVLEVWNIETIYIPSTMHLLYKNFAN